MRELAYTTQILNVQQKDVVPVVRIFPLNLFRRIRIPETGMVIGVKSVPERMIKKGTIQCDHSYM